MKLKELIDYCNVLKESKGRFINCIDIDRIIDKIKQLDEPEKVKVPQFVADWYEENKDDFELNLWLFLTEFDEENIDRSERFGIWLGNEANNPIQTLVNMHQFGYEVEEEKRYIVSLKNGQPLTKTQSGKVLYFNQNIITGNYKFTRKELEEAGFGWVFDCPGIEIEEVEYDTNA